MSGIVTNVKGICQRALRRAPTDLFSVRVIVDPMTFARRLTEARELRGLSQAQLARLARVTAAWVSKAEAGKNVDVQARTLFAVCRILQVNPEWVAEGTGPRDALPVDLAEEFSGLNSDQIAVIRSVIQSIKK